MDAVVFEGVTKRFDTLTAVDHLSLRIGEGAVFGLLGPNGAGKTTSLRMIMQILIPDEGSIQVLGEPASERTQDRIGYLPEERGLYARMKVREVLRFSGRPERTERGRSGRSAPKPGWNAWNWRPGRKRRFRTFPKACSRRFSSSPR